MSSRMRCLVPFINLLFNQMSFILSLKEPNNSVFIPRNELFDQFRGVQSAESVIRLMKELLLLLFQAVFEELDDLFCSWRRFDSDDGVKCLVNLGWVMALDLLWCLATFIWLHFR